MTIGSTFATPYWLFSPSSRHETLLLRAAAAIPYLKKRLRLRERHLEGVAVAVPCFADLGRLNPTPRFWLRASAAPPLLEGEYRRAVQTARSNP